jgi:NDP-hexose-3-ketoreductase
MPADGDFRLDPFMGGGAFHDLNRYPLSAAQFFLTGKRHRLIEKDVEVAGAFNLCVNAASVTDKEEHFSFMIAFGRHYQSFYEIQGEHGKIRVNRAFTTPCDLTNTIELTVNGKDESFSIPPCDHFLSTIDRVSSMIRDGGHFDSIHVKTRDLAELADLFQ